MAFVNEYISKEDFQKYGIAGINIKRGIGATSKDDWTIDKNRNIYIREIRGGRDEYFYESDWTLFYQDKLIEFGISNLSIDGAAPNLVQERKKIRYIHVPENWADRRDEVISVIQEALAAHKDGGVFSTATDYSLTLDV